MKRSVMFSPNALDELFYLASNEKRLFKALNRVIEDTQRNGTEGIGHPEKLSGDLAGWWSKHVSEGDRMVFRVNDNTVEIIACLNHYADK